MKLVVDSSVAVKWFVDEPSRALAAELLDGDDEFVAPDMLLAEVANALWRKVRIGQLTDAQLSKAISELEILVDLRPVAAALVLDAIRIAREIDHSVYDCIFLACARNERATLVTADAKFAAKAANVTDQSSI